MLPLLEEEAPVSYREFVHSMLAMRALRCHLPSGGLSLHSVLGIACMRESLSTWEEWAATDPIAVAKAIIALPDDKAQALFHIARERANSGSAVRPTFSNDEFPSLVAPEALPGVERRKGEGWRSRQ